MNQIPLIDCHTHTSLSFDCEALPEKMCGCALEKGISVYAVTDHYEHCSDVDDPEETGCSKENWRADVETGFSAIQRVKEEFAARGLLVLCGIELGEPAQDFDLAEQILQTSYDMVIGAVHNIAGHRDFYYLDYRSCSNQELERLMELYFEELYRMAQWGKFDTMAHLDYPLRYMKAQNRMITLRRFDDYVGEVLRLLAEKGKALELNTSRFDYWGDQNPMLHYLRLFYDLGGEYVTVGSDSHSPEQIGFHIKDGYRCIREAGFSSVSYFQERRPVLLGF